MKALAALIICLSSALLVTSPLAAQEAEGSQSSFLLELHPMPDLAIIIDDEFYVAVDPQLADFTALQAGILDSPVILEAAFNQVKNRPGLQNLEHELAHYIDHTTFNKELTINQKFSELSTEDASALSQAIVESYRDYTIAQWHQRLQPQLETLKNQINRKSEQLNEMRTHYLRLAKKNQLPIPSQADPASAKTQFIAWFENLIKEQGPETALDIASQAQGQLDLLTEIHHTESWLKQMKTRAAKAELALSHTFNPITRHAR